MPINLLNYGDPALDGFSACARMSDVESKLSAQKQVSETYVGEGKESYWLRATKNSAPREIHLHIDTTRKSRPWDVPTSNADSLNETLSIFDEYFGNEVFVRSRATFSVPADQLSQHNPISILLRLSIAGDAGNDPIRLTGATFAIGRDETERIEWSLVNRDGREYVSAQVHSQSILELRESLFADSLSSLSEALELFLDIPRVHN